MLLHILFCKLIKFAIFVTIPKKIISFYRNYKCRIPGTSLFKKLTFVKTTTAVIIGSILYKGCVAIAIRFFDPQSMKLITAVLFLVILVISMERKQKAKGMAEGQKGGKNA